MVLPLAAQCGAPAAWCGGMDTEGKTQQDVVWAVGLAQELVFATALRKYGLHCLEVAAAGAADEASTVQLGICPCLQGCQGSPITCAKTAFSLPPLLAEDYLGTPAGSPVPPPHPAGLQQKPFWHNICET